MNKIRYGMFETNSSSVHSICITKKNKDLLKNAPKELVFHHGDYGWKNAIYYDMQNKANYLYQTICDLYWCLPKEKEKALNKISKILLKYDILPIFSEKDVDEDGYEIGNVDHPYDLGEWVESLCRSERKLLRYLFSEESFVITGNDNADHDVSINVNYKHEEYYKGN